MKISIIQLGARHKYSLPIFFFRSNYLHSFITNGYNKGIVKFLFGNSHLLKKRQSNNFKPIYSANFLGFIHYVLRRVFSKSSVRINNYVFLFAAFFLNIYSIVILVLKKSKPSHLYVNNGAGFLIFKFFPKKFKIIEQVIGPRRFMPDSIFIDSVSSKYFDNSIADYSIDLRGRMEEAEWKYADLILCPSNFVYDLMIKSGVHENKLKLLNYGVNTKLFKICWEKNRDYNKLRDLNILFVGEVGLRKGVAYLIESLLDIKIGYKCKFVGSNKLTKDFNNENIEFVGVIDKDKITDYYLWADVLIIPSLWEGSATVIYEATASGLPVIASKNSGAPETSNILELNNINPTEIKNEIIRLTANYINHLPDENDLYHVSNERYLDELINILK